MKANLNFKCVAYQGWIQDFQSGVDPGFPNGGSF